MQFWRSQNWKDMFLEQQLLPDRFMYLGWHKASPTVTAGRAKIWQQLGVITERQWNPHQNFMCEHHHCLYSKIFRCHTNSNTRNNKVPAEPHSIYHLKEILHLPVKQWDREGGNKEAVPGGNISNPVILPKPAHSLWITLQSRGHNVELP